MFVNFSLSNIICEPIKIVHIIYQYICSNKMCIKVFSEIFLNFQFLHFHNYVCVQIISLNNCDHGRKIRSFLFQSHKKKSL
jgi:hypothetical protein